MAQQNEHQNEQMELVQSSQMSTGSDINVQIEAAQRYKRDVAVCLKNARDLILQPGVVEECYYLLERKDKKTGAINKIYGRSIRFAEIIGSMWRNTRIMGRIEEVTPERSIVSGNGFDVENNNAFSIQMVAKTTYSDGNPYNADMQTNAINAMMAKAYRNVVFKMIPNALTQGIFDDVLRMAESEAESKIGEKRSKMVAKFAGVGVGIEKILKKIEKEKLDDITGSDLKVLFGLYTSIAEGHQTTDEAFPPERPVETAGDESLGPVKEKKKADDDFTVEEEQLINGGSVTEPVAEPVNELADNLENRLKGEGTVEKPEPQESTPRSDKKPEDLFSDDPKPKLDQPKKIAKKDTEKKIKTPDEIAGDTLGKIDGAKTLTELNAIQDEYDILSADVVIPEAFDTQINTLLGKKRKELKLKKS